MSILHYTAPPIVGGVENVIAHHARLLLDAGYPVTVLTGRGGQAQALQGAEVVVIPELDSEHPGNLIAQALEQNVVPTEFKSFQARLETAISAACSSSDRLIVHNALNFHLNLPLVAALHRLLDRGQVPGVIAWCHDISRYVNPQSGVPLRYGFPWDLLRTYRPEVTYVAVSHHRQRLLAQALGCPPACIQVVPNGVDPQEIFGLSSLGQHLVEEFDLTSADLVLLMPVRITNAKNIEFALEVTAALKAAGLGSRLLITGPPDPHSNASRLYLDELLARRRALDLEEEVIFLCQGTQRFPYPFALETSTIGELYRICDIVLMPSHREGFGLPILEGALAGKPVFSTEVPALEEIGGEWVHRIEAGESASHVAERICTWATSDLAYRTRRKVRQRFTWSALFASAIEPLIQAPDRP
ncbi:MAG: glycosyltransferase family 4 protein [Chloroflexi bacterium]|nr:glycosyltransferase family 4 protein [Chloroflexota bacterium]